MKMFSLVTRSALALVAGMTLASTTQAATVFSSDFDTSAGLTIVADADTNSTFGYDYSADGIPEAPNSVGGAATTGLKLEANISGGAAQGISAVTSGLALSGLYTVQADIWVNVNGPLPGGGAGSTEFAGVSVGHGGVAPQSGASLIYDGDGGSSRDYRLYKDGGEQFVASGQYAVTSNNNSDPAITASFPGLAPPASQRQTGTTADGTGGFQWMTLLANDDTNAGTAAFSQKSATSGSSVAIGTVDSNVGSAVNLAGDIAVTYTDLFSSVSDSAALSFGVFDNLVVNAIPEPSSLALVSLAGLALCGRRRR